MIRKNGKNYWLAKRRIKGLSPRRMSEKLFCDIQKYGVGIWLATDEYSFIMPNGELISENPIRRTVDLN